jgi:hypothetical protein
MIGTIRRVSHITEGRPNNIAFSIRGPHEPRENAYMIEDTAHTENGTIAPGSETLFRTHVNLGLTGPTPTGPDPAYLQLGNDPAYDAHGTQDHDSDSNSSSDVTGTSSDTSSDDQTERIDMSRILAAGPTRAEQKAYAVREYKFAKKTYRRFVGKPVRKFRRRV